MRIRLVAALALLVASLVAAGSTAARAGSDELATELARALTAPGIAPGRTAALAVDLESGQIVFAHNAEIALAPASAEKLAVSFAALKVLGARFRFQTAVLGSGERAGSVWKGDVYLVGYGDPTLALPDLDALARDLASQGIRRITGRVVGDERHFDAKRVAPGWKPTYLGLESPPLSALSVAGARPAGANGSAAAAARALTTALVRHGVRVAGGSATGRAPPDAPQLARDVSEPLSAIVRRMNTDSDNFVSEMVLKELGATLARRGSTEGGARVVRRELGEAGVPTAGVRIADGSGLSTYDRSTVRSLVAILRAGSEDPEVERVFVRSLAVAGRSGTLERRLDRSPTRGRVRAKTGTTRRASALAGFVGSRYAFAILQNGSPVPYWTARAAQDRFVTILARP
ncbi:MAG TPA: D-alanyl-D-alanine carboxypeptidase/D-alanyl-D-alanine-endopeptidase [Gaiellaceae bacterium]|nr:D-alanyl-D-alanine carboxypeptidase/D-alanyl-D-alanine-endopeptidase [Gaiellaceae bacterium]